MTRSRASRALSIASIFSLTQVLLRYIFCVSCLSVSKERLICFSPALLQLFRKPRFCADSIAVGCKAHLKPYLVNPAMTVKRSGWRVGSPPLRTMAYPPCFFICLPDSENLFRRKLLNSVFNIGRSITEVAVEVALAGNPEQVKMFFILFAGDALLLAEPCSVRVCC